MSTSVQLRNNIEIQECTQAVDELLGRYGWRLLAHDLFIDQTLLAFATGMAATPSRCAIYTYTIARYSACSGSEGRERQNLAYTELAHELFHVARASHGERAEDIVQSALESIHRKFRSCRHPGAFFVFCLQQLRDAMRTDHGQQAKEALTESIEDEGQGRGAVGRLVAHRVDPHEQLQQQELISRLHHLLERFVARYPRAQQQLQVLVLEFFEGLDDVEIARRLGKDSVERVYELRSRARRKLADDPEWREMARELEIGALSPVGKRRSR